MQKAQNSKKSKSVEEVYQKKTQIEHVLLRPDTYVGSTESVTKDMWVWDSKQERIVNKNISYCPGLFTIFGKLLSFALRLIGNLTTDAPAVR